MEITLHDGTANQLIGFQTLVEEKVDQLPAESLGEFAQQGFLMPLFMVLASLSNMQTLIELKNARLEAE